MNHANKRNKKNWVLFTMLFSLLIFSTGFVILRKNSHALDKYLEKNNIKVSIIIPVYNTEKYLDECLNSIENQTLKDIEIICVNDGSKDHSLEILENHAAKDERIKIINKENGGVSSARNNGIKNAKGDYIMFLDSDDSYVPYACEKEYNVAVKNEANVVEFGVKDFTDGEVLDLSSLNYDDSKITVYTKKENENPFSVLNFPCGVVWNKIWKRSFINENNLSFKEGLNRGEDSLFNMLAAPHLNKYIKDKNIIYNYRTGRADSAMTITQADVKKKLDNFLVLIKELSDNRNKFSFDGGDEWLLSTMLWLVKPEIFDKLKDEEGKLYYCRKFLEIIENDFINKYNIPVTVGSENESMIGDMQNFIR